MPSSIRCFASSTSPSAESPIHKGCRPKSFTRPVFSFGCPESYDIDGRESLWSAPRSILDTGENGELEVALPSTDVRVDLELTAEIDTHIEALEAALAAAPRRQVSLEAGEILVISNRRCLHGRPAIEAERWLKRVYLSRDLSGLESVASTGVPSVYAAVKAFGYEGEQGARSKWR